jgi:membrane protease YdiL (CAAX protease family)
MGILAIEASFLVSSAVLLKRHSLSLREIGFRRTVRPLLLVKNGLLLFVVALIAIWSGIQFHIPGSPQNDDQTILRDIMWFTLVPVSEEMLIRGWFQTALSRRNPGKKKQIILFSALAFAALHGFYLLRGAELRLVIWLVILSFPLGLVAASLREKCQSLIPPILAHAFYNFYGILLSRLIAYIIAHP